MKKLITLCLLLLAVGSMSADPGYDLFHAKLHRVIDHFRPGGRYNMKEELRLRGFSLSWPVHAVVTQTDRFVPWSDENHLIHDWIIYTEDKTDNTVALKDYDESYDSRECKCSRDFFFDVYIPVFDEYEK